MEHLIKKSGFTLIELLVSISIIATLTAILLPNFMGARERAKDAKMVQDMTNIKNALRAYYNDTQHYPVGDGITNVESSFLVPTYMGAATGVGYTYYQVDNGDGFTLRAMLESGQGDDDTKSQTRCATGTQTDKLYVVCAN